MTTAMLNLCILISLFSGQALRIERSYRKKDNLGGMKQTQQVEKIAKGSAGVGAKLLAVAFGGGGCFSAVAQTGFMRGLMAQPDDAFTVTTIGSTSGGTWGVTMAMAAALESEGGFLKQYMKKWKNSGEMATVTNGTVSNVRGNELGKWCMEAMLQYNVPQTEWSKNMGACAGCAMADDEWTCMGEERTKILGVSTNCVVNRPSYVRFYNKGANTPNFALLEKENRTKQSALSFMESDMVKETEKGLFLTPRENYMLNTENYQYFMYFENLGVKRNQKLSSFDSLFDDGALVWGIYWSHLVDPYVPFVNTSVTPGNSGVIGTPGTELVFESLITSVAHSSDFPTALGIMEAMQLAENNGGNACQHFHSVLESQTVDGSWPFPFAPVPKELQLILPDKLKWLLKSINQWHTDGPTTSAVWNFDGALTDENAIGETLLMMETRPPATRPKTLVSLITGYLRNDPLFSINHVISYFMPRVEYEQLFLNYVAKSTFINNNKTNCHLNKVIVKNPMNFFTKHTWLGKCHNVLFSAKSDADCWNVVYQAEHLGNIFMANVEVNTNSFWGLTGGWTTGISFSFLTASEQSDLWVDSIYADYPAMKKKLTGHFPILKNALPQLSALNTVETAFAMQSFNAFKGFMTMCSIRFFTSQGKDVCALCKDRNGPNKFLCDQWLPIFSPELEAKAQEALEAELKS